MAISVIAHRWVRVCRKCEFTMVQAIECISYSGIELVILLAGGNKSTQNKDIKTAQQLAGKL
jgi:hypothetical protein